FENRRIPCDETIYGERGRRITLLKRFVCDDGVDTLPRFYWDEGQTFLLALFDNQGSTLLRPVPANRIFRHNIAHRIPNGAINSQETFLSHLALPHILMSYAPPAGSLAPVPAISATVRRPAPYKLPLHPSVRAR